MGSVYKPSAATRSYIRRRQRERRTCVHTASATLGFPRSSGGINILERAISPQCQRSPGTQGTGSGRHDVRLHTSRPQKRYHWSPHSTTCVEVWNPTPRVRVCTS